MDQNENSNRAHEIGDLVEKKIQEELNFYSVVHVDPVDTDSKEVKRANNLLRSLIKSRDDVKGFHDLRTINRPDKKMDFSIYDPIINEVRKSSPEIEVKMIIDPTYIFN